MIDQLEITIEQLKAERAQFAESAQTTLNNFDAEIRAAERILEEQRGEAKAKALFASLWGDQGEEVRELFKVIENRSRQTQRLCDKCGYEGSALQDAVEEGEAPVEYINRTRRLCKIIAPVSPLQIKAELIYSACQIAYTDTAQKISAAYDRLWELKDGFCEEVQERVGAGEDLGRVRAIY